MDPMLLQQQLKHNNKDLLDFSQDLQTWGEEMRKKEQTMHPGNKKSYSSTIPSEPVRNKEKIKDKKSIAPREAKRKCMTYADWEKFDVDKECERVDNDSDSDLTDEFDESMKEEALVMKDKGNKFVKNGNWDEAIKCYTKAIEYFAYDPVFYANRALCHLNKNEMEKVENDCTTSLKLDNTYVKAYQRRAAARESLNKLLESRLDLLRVLELEPKNSESKNTLERINEKIKATRSDEKNAEVQRPISRFTASRQQKKDVFPNSNNCVIQGVSNAVTAKEIDTTKPSTVWPSGDNVTLVKSIKKPPHLRSKKPMKRIKIKEINSIQKLSITDVKEDTAPWPRKDLESKTINSDDFKIIERTLPINGALGDLKNATDFTEINKEVKNLSNLGLVHKSKIEAVEIGELVAPKSSVQFHSTWKRLEGHNDQRYKYLKLMNPRNIQGIFKESLESQIFSEILYILAEYFTKERINVYEYLLNFTKIKRFSALTMFLTLHDKNCLWKMFNWIRECEGQLKEDVDELINKYEL